MCLGEFIIGEFDVDFVLIFKTNKSNGIIGINPVALVIEPEKFFSISKKPTPNPQLGCLDT